MPGIGNDEVCASTKSHSVGFGRSDPYRYDCAASMRARRLWGPLCRQVLATGSYARFKLQRAMLPASCDCRRMRGVVSRW